MHVPYTIQRGNTYYYNRRLGIDVLRLSLRTSAPKRALEIVARIEQEVVVPMEVSKRKLEDIRKAALAWLQRNLDYEMVQEACRPPIEGPEADATERQQEKWNREKMESAKSLIRDRDHHTVFCSSSDALSQEYTLQLNSAELKVLSYHIAQANLQFYERVIDRKLATLDYSVGERSEEGATRLLSVLVEQYLKTKEREVAAQTFNKIRDHLTKFLEVTGDIPLSRFDSEAADSLMDGLYEYPVNRNRHGNDLLSLRELKQKGTNPISHSTVKDMHNKISSFFKWCVDKDYCARNYLEGVGPTSRQAESERRPWTRQELSILFSHKTFNTAVEKEWQYWLPILGLATGARIEELSTLRGTDVRNVDGIWIVDISDIEDGKKLKTINSKRRVPVHEKLIELGLHHLARKRASDLLFPDLKSYATANEKLGKRPSNWFGKLKGDRLGFSGNVAFHSFRHLMGNMLTDAGAGGEVTAAILGHSQQGVTHTVYVKNIRPLVLNKHLQKLPIREILKDVKQHPTGLP